MERRQLLKTVGATGVLGTVSGCLAPSAEATFTYQPSSPTAGEPIVFDASNSERDKYIWEFEDTEGDRLRRTGKKVTIETNEPGAFISTLEVWNRRRDGTPLCGSMTCSKDKQNKRVYVQDPSTDTSDKGPIQIETDQVNILLKGTKTRIALDEKAVLQFSATNLIGNRDLTIQLILETPSGTSVESGAFVESGEGQYVTTFVLEPGEAQGLRIRIAPIEPGRHVINGHAIYYFGEESENREPKDAQIPIIVTS